MYKYKNFSPLSGGVSDAKLEKALMTHDDWMTLTNRQGMMIWKYIDMLKVYLQIK